MDMTEEQSTTEQLTDEQPVVEKKLSIEEKANRYIELESDQQFIDEVKGLLAKGQKKKLKEAFGAELAFGTGGLRGIIGGGFNRMNPYVVGRTAQGIARYLTSLPRKSTKEPLSAVIAYDARRYSPEFAQICAEVFVAHGIRVSLFNGPRPTPLLSFAVRKLNADVGVMITASHNPPEYNGCKVYWRGGAQIVPPHDENIIAEIQRTTKLKRADLEAAATKERPLVVRLEDSIDRLYCDYIYGMGLNDQLVAAEARKLSVTYTPLHGVGAMLFRTLADHFGYHYYMVEEQMEPDGNFPTVKSPNPENTEALALAIKQAEINGSDIILANDPDADRVAVVAWHDEKYHILTGNQVGALIIDYVLDRHTTLKTLPNNGAVIKTIVTTELQRKISESYGVTCHDTLTGFKHIAAKIQEFEETKRGGPQFIVGGEESIGYMYGLEVRDKDGISVAMLILEMALHHKQKGQTLIDRLHHLYTHHGYFEEDTISKVFAGLDGNEKIVKIMETLRNNPPEMIGDLAVHQVRDYREQTVVNCATKMKQSLTGFPVSDVLQFCLVDESTVSVRPSGTEPKIKFYISCRFTPHVSLEQAQPLISNLVAEIRILIETWAKIVA